jgi:hypothetical protein
MKGILTKACAVGVAGLGVFAFTGNDSPELADSRFQEEEEEEMTNLYAGTEADTVGRAMGPEMESGIGSKGEDINYDAATSANGELSQTMNGMVGESTAGVPGTRGGNVACAYAVNEALARTTGAPALAVSQGGLSVAQTTRAIESQPNRFRQVSAQEAISSGRDYVVSSNPAWGSTGSHIGIGNGNTVWSNSSSKASIQQNYSASSWNRSFSTAKYYIVE